MTWQAMPQNPGDVTNALRASAGEARDALDRVMPIVYHELRRIARLQLKKEPDGHTLTTTALVHEAYLKLAGQDRAAWTDRGHFFAVIGQAMRRILIDYARRHRATRRGGPEKRYVSLEALEAGAASAASVISTEDRADSVLALDAGLERLGTISPRLARIVEYRFFAGLSEKETAEALGLSQRTVAREWAAAKGWLYQELRGDNTTTME